MPCTSGCECFMHLDRCSCLAPATALLLWFGKNIFVPKHTLNSSSVCCLTERGVPSPHPYLASADGTAILAVSPQGRPDKDWRKAFTVGNLQLCLSAFLTAKKLPAKNCPPQSMLQDSSLSGLSRIAKYVLEGLLCASRCSAHSLIYP